MLFLCQLLLNFQGAQALIQVRSLSNYLKEKLSKWLLDDAALEEKDIGRLQSQECLSSCMHLLTLMQRKYEIC